ncbi:recombinase family protein [Rhodococcus hoagii]|nr:recombinase family protein [Prescottella equi]
MSAPNESRRVLGRLRLSRATDESTSIDRQRETIQRWADSMGHTIVGWAEDVDVSGSVDPFETPQLGPWLNERLGEWDILAAWKLDRLGRNAIQLNKLFGWCGEHEKTLVSCSESIDLGSWAGRMLAGVIAGLAEGELEAIRERTLGSRRKLREQARWPGGKPPYGYVTVQREAGGGWTLEIDPLAHAVLRQIVDAVIDGKPTTRIVRELNDDGYLTPAQYHESVKCGRPMIRFPDGVVPDDAKDPATGTRKPKWAAASLKLMLTNKSLLGYVHHKGEVVRDDEGLPVQLAEPLVTLDEWEMVQAILERKSKSQKGIRRTIASPLSGIAICYECRQPLHHSRHTAGGREYRYYRCENRHTTQIPADMLEETAEEYFLEQLGDVEIRERVWVSGDSREADLRRELSTLDELGKAFDRVSSAAAKQRIQGQIDAVDARIVELESMPATEARWEYRAVGGTYRAAWESSDTDERRELLRRSGIRIAAKIDTGGERRTQLNAGTHYFHIWVPEEIAKFIHTTEEPPTHLRLPGED